tara:strand:+ start:44193 stop:45338 length:1146 start_codon:yes stop_codon:yes gene_type:complete
MSTEENVFKGTSSRSWIEIRPGALNRNLHRIRESVGPHSAIIPMVKADAYGLGMEVVVRTLETENPWGYGVATVDEGVFIRSLGVTKPIIIVSPLPPDAYDLAVSEGLTPTLSDINAVHQFAASVDRMGLQARFHVEIDTGMGRSGFDRFRVREWGPVLAEFSTDQMILEGCYTHFHSADVANDSSTLEQWHLFQSTLNEMVVSKIELIHSCNGAAAIRYPSIAADAVRPGIFLYGGSVGEGIDPPEEVVQVKARVTLIREVIEGATLGYGATYRAHKNERWATLGIGYGDGFPRFLGNKGNSLLHGHRVPIIGRISMDMIVVDISGIEDVMVGDTATLIGTDGGARITLDEVAQQADTISYEILTGFTGRLPRILIKNGG